MFVILANPENRRVTFFQEALGRRGLAPAKVVAWLDYLQHGELDARQAIVRIDSFGEHFEVQRLLLERGGYPNAAQLVDHHGEVVAPALTHAGFRQTLRQLSSDLAGQPVRGVLNVPEEIDELFDKRRTSRRYRDANVPVPDFIDDPPLAPGELLERCRSLGWRQAFVKLSSGSSASCLAHVELGPRGVTVRTSLEWAAPRWFNNLKVRVLRRSIDIDRTLGFILSQGAQVEQGLEKAKLGEAYFDLRVLCIAGTPRFIVVRQSALPITNLHLGGSRGDLEALRRLVPSTAWDAAMDSCRRVASLYRSLHVGIDLLFEAGFERHAIVEANAFGDLLPNLTVEGRTVWDWEVEAALASSG